MLNWFALQQSKGRLEIVHSTETWRSNQQIAAFSDTIFPVSCGFPPTLSRQTATSHHDGVFAVRLDHVDTYVALHNPLCLRPSRSTRMPGQIDATNFGLAKGLTYERVLIFPSGPIRDFLNKGKPLAEKSACGLYVAVTRAVHSVAFVIDKYKGGTNLPCGKSIQPADEPAWSARAPLHFFRRVRISSHSGSVPLRHLFAPVTRRRCCSGARRAGSGALRQTGRHPARTRTGKPSAAASRATSMLLNWWTSHSPKPPPAKPPGAGMRPVSGSAGPGPLSCTRTTIRSSRPRQGDRRAHRVGRSAVPLLVPALPGDQGKPRLTWADASSIVLVVPRRLPSSGTRSGKNLARARRPGRPGGPGPGDRPDLDDHEIAT